MSNIISSLITKKAQELITTLAPTLGKLIEEIGIKNVGQPNMSIPDICLTINKLNEIERIRNDLYESVNNTATIINKLSGPVDILNKVITTTTATLVTVKTARLITNAAIKAIPSPPGTPGVIVSTLSDIKDLEEFLTPKIAVAQVSITTISLALDFANEILAKIMSVLSLIDDYLKKCLDVPPPGRNEALTKAIESYNKTLVTNNVTNRVYQGFILDIVEEPYSPTVNRRKAVAKNTNGIILLQTPLSFTTNNRVLIEELKLIINKSDLKAY